MRRRVSKTEEADARPLMFTALAPNLVKFVNISLFGRRSLTDQAFDDTCSRHKAIAEKGCGNG